MMVSEFCGVGRQLAKSGVGGGEMRFEHDEMGQSPLINPPPNSLVFSKGAVYIHAFQCIREVSPKRLVWLNPLS